MSEYEFSIVIRDADFSNLKVHDALFESGCDDALICANNNTVYLKFTREANSAHEAIDSALSNIKDAGFRDLIVEESGAITISEIASKAELSRQAIHNYVKGLRGDGNFPKPIAGLSSNNPLYDWYEVAQWLNSHKALSKESLEVAQVSKYFNHNMPMSPLNYLQLEAINHVNFKSTRPDWEYIRAVRCEISATTPVVHLGVLGNKTKLYEDIHGVKFCNSTDVEDAQTLTFLSAQR